MDVERKFVGALCEEAGRYGVEVDDVAGAEALTVANAMELLAERIQALREEQEARDRVSRSVLVVYRNRAHVQWEPLGIASSADAYLRRCWVVVKSSDFAPQDKYQYKLVPLAQAMPSSSEFYNFRDGNEQYAAVPECTRAMCPRGPYVVASVLTEGCGVRAAETLEQAIAVAEARRECFWSQDRLRIVITKTAEGGYEEVYRTAPLPSPIWYYPAPVGVGYYTTKISLGLPREQSDEDSAVLHCITHAHNFEFMFSCPR